MPFMTAQSYFGVAKEATRGTSASITGVASVASLFIPVNSPSLVPDIKWINQDNFVGAPTKPFDAVPAVRADKYSGKCYVHNDVFPWLIVAALGGADTAASVTGASVITPAGASVQAYSHTIGLLNSASLGSQPPSFTVWNNSVDAQYSVPGSQLVDMSVAFQVDAAVECSFNFVGNAFASVGANSVYSSITETTYHLIPAWNTSASIGGSAVTVVEQATLDIKRNTAPIWTIGSQSPHSNFADALEISGKLTLVVEANQTYLAQAFVANQQALALQFTDPVSNGYTNFTMSKVQLENAKIVQSKAYTQIEADFMGIANATDGAVSGGYSPIQTVTRNAIIPAYN